MELYDRQNPLQQRNISATARDLPLLQASIRLLKQTSSNGLEKRPKLRFPGFDEPWKATAFGDIVHEFSNRTKVEDEDVLLSAAIEGMFLNTELFGHQRGASNKGYKKIKYGTMVLSTQNLHLGNANVNQRFEHGMVSPAYKTYDISGCSIDLIAQWIKSDAAKRFFYNATTVGASVCRRNVEWDTLYEQSLFLPSLPEQEKIANLLTLLSNRIEKQRQVIIALKKYKRGVMRAIFRDKSFVFSKATVWKSIRLGDECVFFSGGTPKSTDSSYYGGSIPFIRSGEIHGEKTELFLSEAGLQNSSAKMVSKGDLLIALYGATSGEVDISKIDGAINQAILCIRPYDMSKQYLRYLLEDSKDDIINTYLQGGQGNLSAEIIKNLRVDIPDSTAQSSVVEFLSMIERRIEMSIAECEQIQAMKRSSLQQLFI